MPNLAVVDAGPLIVLFNKKDPAHEQVRTKVITFKKNHGHLITTWPVITEATYLLRRKVSSDAAFDLLQWISLYGMQIFYLTVNHIHRMITFQRKYRDCAMDFADASVLVAAEDNKTNQFFSLDFRDFKIYRLFKNKPLQNLIDP